MKYVSKQWIIIIYIDRCCGACLHTWPSRLLFLPSNNVINSLKVPDSIVYGTMLFGHLALCRL